MILLHTCKAIAKQTWHMAHQSASMCMCSVHQPAAPPKVGKARLVRFAHVAVALLKTPTPKHSDALHLPVRVILCSITHFPLLDPSSSTSQGTPVVSNCTLVGLCTEALVQPLWLWCSCHGLLVTLSQFQRSLLSGQLVHPCCTIQATLLYNVFCCWIGRLPVQDHKSAPPTVTRATVECLQR